MLLSAMFGRISPRARRLWIVIGVVWLAIALIWSWLEKAPDQASVVKWSRHAWAVAAFESETGTRHQDYVEQCYEDQSQRRRNGLEQRHPITAYKLRTGTAEERQKILDDLAKAKRIREEQKAANFGHTGFFVGKPVSHLWDCRTNFPVNARPSRPLKMLWNTQWFGSALLMVFGWVSVTFLAPLAALLIFVHWIVVPIFRWIRAA